MRTHKSYTRMDDRIVNERGEFALEISEWKASLEREREEKNRFFVLDPRSPIPLEERSNLVGKGLSYFPPDPDLRFELVLYEHKEKKKIIVATSKDGEREFVRWGEFRFEVNGNQYVLQAYKSGFEEERLWVPFRDKTSGKETYGAGRYLDLEPERHRTAEGKWILDLNKAYNPWCAYSEAYTCPFIPPENWLKVPIRAGEKNYPFKRK
jgi:uncharacterized protein (DUF1684 family)